MPQYYVSAGGEEHRVDHPPIFACREHKALLTFSGSFVGELLASAQDIIPGNPDEIAASYCKVVEPAFTLPGFLIPPKIALFNPRNMRGPEALPYLTVLVDKKFFGIPARYLTPDRFDGCETCKTLKPAMRPRPVRSGHASGVRRAPPEARKGGKRPEKGGKPRPKSSGPRPRPNSKKSGPRPRGKGAPPKKPAP